MTMHRRSCAVRTAAADNMATTLARPGRGLGRHVTCSGSCSTRVRRHCWVGVDDQATGRWLYVSPARLFWGDVTI
jgi:hypothetical protein